MKQLRRKGLTFDHLITPTLKVAGSNPIGRTTKNPLNRNGLMGFLFCCQRSGFGTECAATTKIIDVKVKTRLTAQL